MFDENELLPISSLQHALFCERQFSLIHLEGLWRDNRYTIEGNILHERVDSIHHESRGAFYQEFSMMVHSFAVGLVGICDLVEFEYSSDKKILSILPVEEKRGRKKQTDVDRVQLCAQAICLTEMTGIEIPMGQIYYLQNHRRIDVMFDAALREKTLSLVQRCQDILAGTASPLAVYNQKRCDNCSLVELCCPKIIGSGKKHVSEYIDEQLRNSLDSENDQGDIE
jgi:CRISPR-associated exonuclease Cas4